MSGFGADPLVTEDVPERDDGRGGIGWYISDTHARRAIGYLSGKLSQLALTPVPEIAEAWGEALERTIDPEERSPIGAEAGTLRAEVERLRRYVLDDEEIARLAAVEERTERAEAALAAANRTIERLRVANDAYWTAPQGDRVLQRQQLMDVLYDLHTAIDTGT